MTEIEDGVPPRLGARARGWLRHLHRKATTPDDWSSAGRPAPWWDDRSTAPVLSFPRFDLSESSYAVAMMADVTPAWREAYVAIMDGLIDRHRTHWAAIDWLTQIGHDPDRAHYPAEWVKLWMPEHLVGHYDMPGWTANGVDPWGLAPDPIAAEGNLFFKGWFNLLLGIHGYVSRDRHWNQPFAVTGMHEVTYSWTHDGINALLTRQWGARPEGPHCENTKVWPFCLSAAGLGLRLHDVLTGGSDHAVFDQWVNILTDRYLRMTPDGHVERTALYFDPIADYIHWAGPTSGLSIALYMQPQAPALAETLYRTAVEKIGWNNPAKQVRSLPDPRMLLLGLVLAREFGDQLTHARLAAFVEASFEPGFFGPDADEFGWGFGLGEPHPRGQLNALLMMSEVGTPGAWARVFTEPNLAKFDQPTVSGVDFPNVGLDVAWFDAETGILHVGTYAATAAARGRSTTVRVTQLPDAAACTLRCDGAPYERWRVLDATSIEIDLDIAEHTVEVDTGSGPAAPGPAAATAAPVSAALTPAAPPVVTRTSATPARPWRAWLPASPCACC